MSPRWPTALSVSGRGVWGTANELFDPFLEHRPLEKHAAAAHPALQTDIGAEPHDFPFEAAARVRFTQPHHVAELDLQDRGYAFWGESASSR
jgi:hypothetical protein